MNSTKKENHLMNILIGQKAAWRPGGHWVPYSRLGWGADFRKSIVLYKPLDNSHSLAILSGSLPVLGTLIWFTLINSYPSFLPSTVRESHSLNSWDKELTWLHVPCYTGTSKKNLNRHCWVPPNLLILGHSYFCTHIMIFHICPLFIKPKHKNTVFPFLWVIFEGSCVT